MSLPAAWNWYKTYREKCIIMIQFLKNNKYQQCEFGACTCLVILLFCVSLVLYGISWINLHSLFSLQYIYLLCISKPTTTKQKKNEGKKPKIKINKFSYLIWRIQMVFCSKNISWKLIIDIVCLSDVDRINFIVQIKRLVGMV